MINNYEDNRFDDYNLFLYNLDSMIKKREPDTELLHGRVRKYDIDSISTINNGRVDFLVEGVIFECFFHYKNSDKLYVFLNGALKGERPEFKRWSYYQIASGSLLNIADPMYREYDSLRLGWYYGTENRNYRKEIAYLVEKVANSLNIKSEDIIFFGSSGGGSAAIECAEYIEGATVVAINPQMILSDHFLAKDFYELTGNNLEKNDKWNRNDIRKHICSNSVGKRLIMFNIRSERDMVQAKKMADYLKVSLKYGLNIVGNVQIWLYDADGGSKYDNHVVQENKTIFEAIEFFLIYDSNFKGKDIMSSYVYLINDFWRDYWNNKKQSSKNINLKILKTCILSGRDIAVWGVGYVLSKLENILLLNSENLYNVKIIIDKDIKKQGKKIGEIIIQSPDSIDKWGKLFLIITTDNGKMEIADYIEKKGMTYKFDYIYWDDLFE